MKEVDCYVPWFGFAVTTKMTGQMCCTNNNSICEINDTTNLKQIWEQNFTKMREGFLNKGIPIICRPCYKMESFGLRSRRIRFMEDMNKTILPIDFSNPTINYLDIIFSNVCNLDCVMCSSEYSSSWIEDDKKLVTKLPFRKNIEPFLKISKLSKKFIDQIIIKDLIEVEVKGGEPLIESRFTYFLNRCLKDKGNARIHITTNLNVLTSEMKELLQQLPKVSFDVSIDAIGPLYNYIRGNNSSLDRVVENLKFITKLKNLVGGGVRINVTTMPYNLWESYKIIEWANNISKSIKINWCPMTVEPIYLNPIIVPHHMRKKAAIKFEKYVKENNIHSDYIFDLEYTLNYLKHENPLNLTKKYLEYLQESFVKWTKEIHKQRNLNIYELVPEIKEIEHIILNNKNN